MHLISSLVISSLVSSKKRLRLSLSLFVSRRTLYQLEPIKMDSLDVVIIVCVVIGALAFLLVVFILFWAWRYDRRNRATFIANGKNKERQEAHMAQVQNTTNGSSNNDDNHHNSALPEQQRGSNSNNYKPESGNVSSSKSYNSSQQYPSEIGMDDVGYPESVISEDYNKDSALASIGFHSQHSGSNTRRSQPQYPHQSHSQDGGESVTSADALSYGYSLDGASLATPMVMDVNRVDSGDSNMNRTASGPHNGDDGLAAEYGAVVVDDEDAEVPTNESQEMAAVTQTKDDDQGNTTNNDDKTKTKPVVEEEDDAYGAVGADYSMEDELDVLAGSLSEPDHGPTRGSNLSKEEDSVANNGVDDDVYIDEHHDEATNENVVVDDHRSDDEEMFTKEDQEDTNNDSEHGETPGVAVTEEEEDPVQEDPNHEPMQPDLASESGDMYRGDADNTMTTATQDMTLDDDNTKQAPSQDTTPPKEPEVDDYGVGDDYTHTEAEDMTE